MPFLPSLNDDAFISDLKNTFPDLPSISNGVSLMRGPSPLSIAERELIIAYVSRLNNCDLCHDVHADVSCQLGVDQQVIDKIFNREDLTLEDTRIAPLLDYVHKLTRRPGAMKQADVDKVFEAGWSELALVHAIGICSFYCMMNRMVNAAGVKGTIKKRKHVAARMARKGYTGKRKRG
ncbi:MAG: peroxidase [Hellea sp.]|nr:peroxidase [Hellea sp.]